MEKEELNCSKGGGGSDDGGGSNEGILALAEAVLGEPDEAHLSPEETGAAEELLALASEASLSSPINRETIQTPLENENRNLKDSGKGSELAPRPNTGTSSNIGKHVCSNCAATSTPFWRKFSDGNYYCNACGLYLRTHNAMRPLSLSKNRETRRGKMRPELCGNCGATDTPMWRKTEDGMVVCNACGLYHKLHGQHRRSGMKRSGSTGADKASGSPTRKQVRSNHFTLVNENSQIPAKSTASTTGKSSAKYSLDNQYHHKFDPSRVNGNQQNSSAAVDSPVFQNVLPVVEVQPVDARKLAYLKCSQGRTALLAPKLPLEQSQQQHCNTLPMSTPSPFVASSPMPPILTNFINSLATTSPENLTVDQVEHPLQPLLTSIVSQKLKEQKIKYQRNSASPVLQSSSTNSSNIPIPMQIYHHQQQQQQLQQQQENYSNLAEFLQSQQQAIYNQQMIQQAIYNHVNENNGYVSYNPEYANTIGYANYQQENAVQYQQQGNMNNQHQFIVTQNPNLHYNIPAPSLQMPQIGQYPQEPQPQPQQQGSVYFTDQFPDPPLRQLSPFSGIKFDKNLIDLVNMQFWQDNNGVNSNQDNSSDQNSNSPF